MPTELGGRTLYNTSEACRMAGTNRDTFLRWVREGKFPDVTRRDRNGWRLFTRADVRQLRVRVNHVSSAAPTRTGPPSKSQGKALSMAAK